MKPELVLDDDEKKVITDEYLKLKQNGKIHFAYEHLKASADAPTIEVVMKFLLKLEKRNNQFTNEKPVYLYIMENIPSGTYLPFRQWGPLVHPSFLYPLKSLQIILNWKSGFSTILNKACLTNSKSMPRLGFHFW